MVNKKRNTAIDGIRGILAIVIALFRFEKHIPFGDSTIFGKGYLGVEFFFVLSGFLLAKGYETRTSKGGKISIRNSIKEKIIRLYPPYIIATFLLAVLYAALWFDGNILRWLNSDIAHIKGIWYEIFGIQALGIDGFNYINYPAWYVSALLVGTFVLLILLKYCKWFKYLSILVAMTFYFWIAKLSLYNAPSAYVCAYISVPLIRALAGMSLGIFVWGLYGKVKGYLEKIPFIFVTLIEAVMCFIIFGMLVMDRDAKGDYIILIGIVGFIITTFSTKGAISYALSNRVIGFLGKISYSFYLVQSVCSNYVLNKCSHLLSWQQIVICLLLNIVLGAMLHFIVEEFFCKKLLKKYKIIRILSIFTIAVISCVVMLQYRKGVDGDIIKITALSEQNEQAEGSEIWLEKINVDGKSYLPEYLFEKDWISKDGSLGWRVYEQPVGLSQEITGIIPYGEKREIIFEANKWRGKAKISFMDTQFVTDCYEASEQGVVTIQLEAHVVANYGIDGATVLYFFMWTLTIVLLLWSIIRIYIEIIGTKDNQAKEINVDKRKIWVDVLRIFCMFNVVLLHATCDGYITSFSNQENWIPFLYINCFTACAVPMFFMISGSLLIRKEENYFQSLLRRMAKIMIPLVSWSVIYIIFRKYYLGESINIWESIIKIGTEPQYYHLWFVYTLCGVYLLCPLISYFYYNTNKKLFCYMAVLFGAVPLILRTLEVGFGYSVNISALYAFFPEVMLFVLGKWLADNKDKLLRKWYVWPVVSFAGYGMVVVLTYYYSLQRGTPLKSLFSNYGTIPIFIMYIALYMLFLSKEELFQKLNKKVKKVICVISDSCMDIYFVHMLVYMILEGRRFAKWTLSIKSDSLLFGIGMAVLCFVVSLIISLIIKRGFRLLLRLNKK